jgi:hypothetical protein
MVRGISPPPGDPTVNRIVEYQRRHEMDGVLVLRHVYIHPPAGAAAVKQRCHQHGDIEMRRHEIGINTQFRRLAVGPAGNVVEAGQPGKLESPAGMPGKRPGLPLHAGTEHDDIRFYLPEYFISQSHSLHRSSGETLQHDIRPGNDFFGDFQSFGFCEIKSDALLAGIPRSEMSAEVRLGAGSPVMARTASSLYLYHLGSVIAEGFYG